MLHTVLAVEAEIAAAFDMSIADIAALSLKFEDSPRK
jgi:hypothetical protein